MEFFIAIWPEKVIWMAKYLIAHEAKHSPMYNYVARDTRNADAFILER